MWLYDIHYNAYCREMGRQFFVVKRTKDYDSWQTGYLRIKFPKRRLEKAIYTIVEEWHTAESQGNTADWDYYTFMTYRDAAIFIAELVMRLNNSQQNFLLQAAENLVTKITEEHKKSIREMQSEQKKVVAVKKDKVRNIPCAKPKTHNKAHKIPTQQEMIDKSFKKSTYIFDMGNGTVKIGITNDIANRRNTIMGHSGLFIKQYCYTPALLTETAIAIEADCHKHFKEQNVLGEFFKISYEEAKEYLLTHSSNLIEESN